MKKYITYVLSTGLFLVFFIFNVNAVAPAQSSINTACAGVCDVLSDCDGDGGYCGSVTGRDRNGEIESVTSCFGFATPE